MKAESRLILAIYNSGEEGDRIYWCPHCLEFDIWHSCKGPLGGRSPTLEECWAGYERWVK